VASWRDLFRDPVRDLLATGATLIVIAGSLVALVVGRVDLGVSLAIAGDRVVIDRVEPGSPASREGFAPGMVVLTLNGLSLIRFPEPEEPSVGPDAAVAEPSAEPSPAISASPSAPGTAAPTVGPGAEPTAPSTFPPAGPVESAPAGGGSPGPSESAPSPSPSAIAPIVPPLLPTASPTIPAGPSPAVTPRRPESVLVLFDPRVLPFMLSEPVRQLDATTEDVLAASPPERPHPYWFTYLGRDYVGELERSGYLFLAGLLMLVVGSWFLATGRAGEALRPLAVPLAAAAALPLLARPLEATWTSSATALAAVAVPFGIAPLGLALADRIQEVEARGIARAAAVGAAALAMLLGLGRALWPGTSGRVTDAGIVASDVAWIVLAASAAMIPGLLAGFRRRPAEVSGPSSRVVQSNELALAGTTPLLSLTTGISSLPLFLPLSGWLAAIAVAGRWTVRPLLRVAARATLQRDLVVAATEAERARVAAEIHDDALQELTLLVRRLDEAGDAEGAEIARTVSERLRAITGDLRLPILDDLGVGPALDWLARRMERLSGGPVRLERVGDARLPADVELAFFRIAQEALGNAVKHGKAPITIRYHASEGVASLSVDDAGPGIAPEATEPEEGSGRFGIVNMRQRAEQIGALLDIRRWPTGGTHVALEWRAR
jgi:signal transduction histidine kinase